MGRALAALPTATRDGIVVATKFGLVFDEQTRTGGGSDLSPAAIRRQCNDSLRRLGRDRIDVLQLHGGAADASVAEDVVAVLQDLVVEGRIGWFGTSQDEPEIIEVFARSTSCVSVQTQANVFGWSSGVMKLARERGLSVLARSPLAMGLLGGGYSRQHRPALRDVRLDPWWTYFDDDAMGTWLGTFTPDFAVV